MIRISEIRLPLEHPPEALDAAVRERLGLPPGAEATIRIARRGYDARKRGGILLVYTLDVSLDRDREREILRGDAADRRVGAAPDLDYRFSPSVPRGAARPVVIGAGPCGLFAALVLAQWGLRPIVLERGREVRARTVDTFGLWRRGVLDPDSNVQFGEGGAGTFSDGKLWSGIRDPERLGRKVLTEMVRAGAPEEILFVSKPHVGTFRLVTVVTRMREEIERLGGTYRFGTHVTGFETVSEVGSDPEVSHDGASGDGATVRRLAALRLADGETLPASHVVLAPGHSARDTFATLHEAGVAMDAKPFSVGVRIEHPQSVIDRARFGDQAGHPLLGAADYKLVHHASDGRSVYSFCMCPGGQVVAASSEPGRVVTNGMSQYSRAERNANAGIVVGVTPERDYPGGPLAGIALQRALESLAFEAGGGDYRAPAQTVGDFLAGRPSRAFGAVVPSYRPGVTPTDLARCLPPFVVAAIRDALPAFGRRIRGFDHPDAVMTGVETRTSSPLRIRRGPDRQSPSVRGLFPAGEGAGYAGGIMSAAIDGIRTAEALASDLAGGGAESGRQSAA